MFDGWVEYTEAEWDQWNTDWEKFRMAAEDKYHDDDEGACDPYYGDYDNDVWFNDDDDGFWIDCARLLCFGAYILVPVAMVLAMVYM